MMINSDRPDMRSTALYPFLLVFFLFTAACGDVGDAPEARTGEAVAAAQHVGTALPVDTTQSTLAWKAAKVTRAHDGGFRVFDGAILVDGEAVTGARFNIDTRSIWSDSERLTSHLKSDDFFEVETYPKATFETVEIVPADSAGATHLVTGNLTMHGQTRAVTFPATITMDDGAVRTRADFLIDRTQWGINYKGKADDLIENDVRLLIDVVAPTTPPVARHNGESEAATEG